MNPTIRRFGSAPILATMVCSLWLAGCATSDSGSEDGAAADTDAAESQEAEGGGDQPRVFLVNMEDGGTYPTSIDVRFGVENYIIEPVEDPPVVREGRGHYHIAVDVDCAPQGEIIVAGNPGYIHFGTGADNITLQFAPGEHRVCLQIGDGEHRVPAGEHLAGLSHEIRFTVAEQ